MLSVIYAKYRVAQCHLCSMLFMLSVVILNVVAPIYRISMLLQYFQIFSITCENPTFVCVVSFLDSSRKIKQTPLEQLT
jgi:hypothetical protein